MMNRLSSVSMVSISVPTRLLTFPRPLPTNLAVLASASLDDLFPRSKLIQRAIVRRIEMDRRQRHKALFYCLMVRIFASAPRDSRAGDPIIAAPMGIEFFNDGIVESTPAQARRSDSANG